jgi:hypothetical protein
MDRRSKKLVYKIATGAKAGSTLQNDLIAALALRPKAKSRLEKLGPNGDEARLINETRTHSSVLCGSLHRFTSGAAQVIISIDDDAKEWAVEQMVPPPTETAKHREFIEGLLFFGIWKNHVILLQSMACRANQLEDYLNWLLNPPTEGVPTSPAPEPIMLNDLVPQKIRKEPFTNVEKITLFTGLESEIVEEPTTVKKTTEVKGLKFKPTREMWTALKAIFKGLGSDLTDEIPLESALEKDDLRVRLELYCSKKSVVTAGPVMNMLATSLRHVEENLYKVRFADGRELDGKELKVSKQWQMDCVNNIPVMTQLHGCMFEYLKELIDTGVVVEQESLGNVK